MSRTASPADEPHRRLPPGCRNPVWLGDGKDGKVYRVTRADGSAAALKVVRLRDGVADGLNQYWFIVGVEPHPHLVRYHEVWLRTADGRFLDPAADLDEIDPDDSERMDLLILMEFAEQTLAGRMRPGPGAEDVLTGCMDAAEVVGLVAQAADGLDHLHRPIHDLGGDGPSRVVHRDVKPANLLLVGGVVKVSDFGVARAQRAGVRATISIACTPEYAPPEVYTNDPVPASDQYSLAVTHYQLRTGALPFEGPPIVAHMQGSLEFGRVGPAEAEVLRRATARRPADRFPSCRAFADAVRAAVGPAGMV